MFGHSRQSSQRFGILWVVSNGLGDCLVTVTADSAVRLWELDRKNAWSFDSPRLAIDLKKLIDGSSSDEDFTPSGFGKNKGFSADSFDMEVASACFGGSGLDEEDGWASMTLWVAMKTGTVYALCPLLPSKWQASSTLIPALSTAIVPKLAAVQQDTSATEDDRKACQQQYDWLSEIDNQEPMISNVPDDLDFSAKEIRARPTNPSAIPRLQGPFQFETDEEDDDLDLTDIHVIAAKIDADELLSGEDDFPEIEATTQGGVSATIICLATTTGQLHVCLDLEGVQGQDKRAVGQLL